jgi:hypothetical protein
MAGQHWGERNGKASPAENAIIGILSTLLAIAAYGGLLLLVLG